jgi:hypothetical protein
LGARLVSQIAVEVEGAGGLSEEGVAIDDAGGVRELAVEYLEENSLPARVRS